MKRVLRSASSESVDVDRETMTISLTMKNAPARSLELSVEAAQQLTNELLRVQAALQQQIVSRKKSHPSLEYLVPLRVNQISVQSDQLGEGIAIWFEKDASFRLLWSLEPELTDQLIEMLQKAKEVAESRRVGASRPS